MGEKVITVQKPDVDPHGKLNVEAKAGLKRRRGYNSLLH